VHPLTKRAAETLDFDPLHLIASGSLLIVVRAADVSAAQFALKNAGFESVVVGHMGEPLTAPIPDPVEELWRLLKLGA
jgi:hydrogenase expression/formation protein HypE